MTIRLETKSRVPTHTAFHDCFILRQRIDQDA
jgi:hypothetical protein